jgi:hypothetical protein
VTASQVRHVGGSCFETFDHLQIGLAQAAFRVDFQNVTGPEFFFDRLLYPNQVLMVGGRVFLFFGKIKEPCCKKQGGDEEQKKEI